MITSKELRQRIQTCNKYKKTILKNYNKYDKKEADLWIKYYDDYTDYCNYELKNKSNIITPIILIGLFALLFIGLRPEITGLTIDNENYYHGDNITLDSLNASSATWDISSIADKIESADLSSDHNRRNIIEANLSRYSGNQIRIALQAGNSNASIANLSICERDNQDCAGELTMLYWNGDNDKLIYPNNLVYTDWANFSFDEKKDYLITFYWKEGLLKYSIGNKTNSYFITSGDYSLTKEWKDYKQENMQWIHKIEVRNYSYEYYLSKEIYAENNVINNINVSTDESHRSLYTDYVKIETKLRSLKTDSSGRYNYSLTSPVIDGIYEILVNSTYHNVDFWKNASLTVSTPPIIILTNQTNGSQVFVTDKIYFNITDNDAVSKAWYSIDSGANNNTFVNSSNIYYLNTTDWQFIKKDIYVWANDTAGNLNSTRFTFNVTGVNITIDSIPYVTVSTFNVSGRADLSNGTSVIYNDVYVWLDRVLKTEITTFVDDSQDNWLLGEFINASTNSSETYRNITLNQTSGNYALNGTFISQVFDAGNNVKWLNLTIASNEPAGTNITFQVRSCAADPCTDSWSNVLAYPLVLNTTITPVNRYFQYKTILKTNDTLITPTLEWVNITYRSSTDSSGNYNVNITSPSPDGIYEVLVNLTYHNVDFWKNISVSVDTMPPYFSFNRTNFTELMVNYHGQFNITVTDGLSDIDTVIFAIKNHTAAWENHTTFRVGSGSTIDLAFNLTVSTTKAQIQYWKFYANDTNGFMNESHLYQITISDTPASWSNNGTNFSSIKVNQNGMFNVTVSDDDYLDRCIFSLKNSSALDWYNYSALDISGTAYDLRYNITISSTQGQLLQWRYYCNDSGGVMYNSSIYNIIIADTYPEFITNIGDDTLNEDDPLTNHENINGYCADADNDAIVYSVSAEDADKVDVNLIGTQITHTPFPNWNGTVDATIGCTANLVTVNDIYTITVNPVQDRMIFTRNGTNATEFHAADNVMFNVTVNENDTIDSCIFSIKNSASAGWSNYTAFGVGVVNYNAQYIISITSTVGQTLSWRYYCNDTEGVMSNSSINDIFIVDKPASFYQNGTNSSAIRSKDNVRFNITVYDPDGLSVYIFSLMNSTDNKWYNDTPVDITGNSVYDIYTTHKINGSIGQAFNWRYYVNDSGNYMYASDIHYFALVDYVMNFTKLGNNFTAGKTDHNSMFNVTIHDQDELSYYIFSLKNNSADSWYNYSTVDITGRATEYFANVTHVISTVEGEMLQWRYYASDIEGNVYASPIVNVTIGDSEPPQVSLDTPTNNSKQTNTTVIFRYTPVDKHLDSCVLYHNASGSLAANITNRTSMGMINATQVTNILNLEDGFYQWNVWCNDTIANAQFNSSDNYIIGIDTTYPEINLTTPIDQEILGNPNILFNYTLNETNPDTCYLYTNVTGNWEIKETNSSVINGINLFRPTLSDGNILYGIYCIDLFGLDKWSDNRTIILDSGVPPTPINLNDSGDYDRDGNFTLEWDDVSSRTGVNYSVYESIDNGLTWIVVYYYNLTVSQYNAANKLDSKNYTYMVTARNNIGNWSTNSSKTNGIYIDLTDPVVTLDYPANYSWYINRNVTFKYTPYDNTLDTCKLYHNASGAWQINLTNTTRDGLINATQFTVSMNISDGTIIWNVECIDKVNRSAFSSANYTLRIDATDPIITLVYPLNATRVYDNLISFNYSTEEPNLDACRLYTNFTGNWTLNSTNDNPVEEMNNFTMNLTDGNYLWGIWCNDSATNSDYSSNYSFRLFAAKINITAPSNYSIFYPGNITNIIIKEVLKKEWINNVTLTIKNVNYTAENYTSLNDHWNYIYTFPDISPQLMSILATAFNYSGETITDDIQIRLSKQNASAPLMNYVCSNSTNALNGTDAILSISATLDTLFRDANLTVESPSGRIYELKHYDYNQSNLTYILYYDFFINETGKYMMNASLEDIENNKIYLNYSFTAYENSSLTTINISALGTSSITIRDICAGNSLATGTTSVVATIIENGLYDVEMVTTWPGPVLTYKDTILNSSVANALNYTVLPKSTLTPPSEKRSILEFQMFNNMSNYEYVKLDFNYDTIEFALDNETGLTVSKCTSVSDCVWIVYDVVLDIVNNIVSVNITDFSVFMISETATTPAKIVQITAQAAGGGGGGGAAAGAIIVASLRMESLPFEVGIDKEVTVPIVVTNDGKISLNKIIFATENDPGLYTEMIETEIDRLNVNEQKNVSFLLRTTNRTGRYKITVFANVTTPKFTEFLDIYLDVSLPEWKNRTIIIEKIEFAADFFRKNPECLEFGEVLKEAESLMDASEYTRAAMLIESAVDACKELVSQREKVEWPGVISRLSERQIFIIEMFIYLILLVGMIVYYKRRKNLKET